MKVFSLLFVSAAQAEVVEDDMCVRKGQKIILSPMQMFGL